jgi:hypothetical protein
VHLREIGDPLRSAAEWMTYRLARARFPGPARYIRALREHRHVHGGSDALAALLEPGIDWQPDDIDIFGLCREQTEQYPRTDDFHHHTPFVHDAFGFSAAFRPHEDMPSTATRLALEADPFDHEYRTVYRLP